MKKLASAAALAVLLFAGSALAGDFISENFPTDEQQQLQGVDNPSGYAPENFSCRTGYKRVPAYCWDRANGGWYQCGWRCEYDEFTGGA